MHFLNHEKDDFLEYFLNTRNNINHNPITDFPVLTLTKLFLHLEVSII